MLNMLEFYQIFPLGETRRHLPRRPLSNTRAVILRLSNTWRVFLSEAENLFSLRFPAILELRPDWLVRQGAGHEDRCRLALPPASVEHAPRFFTRVPPLVDHHDAIHNDVGDPEWI